MKNDTSDNTVNVHNTTVTYTLKELITEMRNDTDSKVGEMRAEVRDLRTQIDSTIASFRHWQIGVISISCATCVLQGI